MAKRAVVNTARQDWPGTRCISPEQRVHRIKNLEAHWATLHRVCSDRLSRARLTRLVDRLTGLDPGSRESALAELELATQLIRAGFSVRFLPESQSKTADFECRLGPQRFFLEVTALPGSSRVARQIPSRRARYSGKDEEEEESGGLDLTDRLVARIAKKAPQLLHYSAPVLVAITVPHTDRPRWAESPSVDLKRMAGALTLMLARWRHISAVFLSLWDVEPLPARAAIRLSNLFALERSRHQKTCPRVRMLLLNPACTRPLQKGEVEALRSLL